MTEKVESIDLGLIQDQIMFVKFCVHWSRKSGIYLTWNILVYKLAR